MDNTCRSKVKARLKEELRSIHLALERVDEEIDFRKAYEDSAPQLESIPVPLPLVFSSNPLSSGIYYL